MSRYLITDNMDGTVYKTDDGERALELSTCEDYFVVDTANGQQLFVIDGKLHEIAELP